MGNMTDDCRNVAWIGFAAGLLAGLAVGVLSAPNSGFETRAIMRAKAMEAQKSAADIIERLKAQTHVIHGNGGAS